MSRIILNQTPNPLKMCFLNTANMFLPTGKATGPRFVGISFGIIPKMIDFGKFSKFQMLSSSAPGDTMSCEDGYLRTGLRVGGLTVF